MALMCIHGGAECTGCMMCRRREKYCDECNERIDGKEYMLHGSDAVYCRRCILKITEV